MTEASLIIAFIACGTALFIDLLLLIDTNSSFIGVVTEIKKIRNIIIAGVIQTLAYLAEYVLSQYEFFGSGAFGMLLLSMLYVGNMLYLLAFSDFVYSKYAKKLYRYNIGRALFLSPIFALIGLEIINSFFPLFFSLDPVTLEYSETPWIAFVNLLPPAYVLFAAFHDIKDTRKNSRYNSLPISLYFIPSLIGMALELVYSDIPAVPISCSISVMIMYMRVLKRVGYIDGLSGVFTKSQISMYINSLLGKQSPSAMLAGIMLDVDRFKHINDTYGHVMGDKAIQAVGDILKAATKKNGICFRYGGDEFVIVLMVSDISEIVELVERINRAVDEFNATKAEAFDLSLSQGYAVYDMESDSVLSFVERMDAEMYANKHASR